MDVLETKGIQYLVVMGYLFLLALFYGWTGQTAVQLNALMGADAGVVLQDGGLPVSGFARQMAGERWPEIAARLLLTSEDPGQEFFASP